MKCRFVLPVCLLTAATACRREEAKVVLPPPLVNTMVLGRQSGQGPSLELRGSVAAQSRLKLGFKQGGVVEAILVREGDRVRKGQLLARQSEVDAKALVRSATALLEKARRDAQRAERLANEGALPTSAKDDAKTAVEAAEAQLSQARDLMERTCLYAPMAGTVFSRMSEPGETLGAGHPLLLLDSTDNLVVRTGVSEREVGELKVGQAVTLALDNQDDWRPGRIRAVGTSPSPADGLYVVEVSPEKPLMHTLKMRAGKVGGSGAIRPGSLVRLRIAGIQKAAFPAIPLEALVRRNEKDHVFVLSGDKVRLCPVQVERSEGRRVLISSGLSQGDRIVSEGAYFLQDGQTVRVGAERQAE